MKHLILALLLMPLTSCATSSGVVQTGPDTFMISRQAGSGFGGLGRLKVDAISEAGRFCIKDGKYLNVLKASENDGPYILGNFPRAEVEFTCTQRGPTSAR